MTTQQGDEALRSIPALIPWSLDDVAIIAGVLDARVATMREYERRLHKTYPTEGAIEKVLAKIYTTYPELRGDHESGA